MLFSIPMQIEQPYTFKHSNRVVYHQYMQEDIFFFRIKTLHNHSALLLSHSSDSYELPWDESGVGLEWGGMPLPQIVLFSNPFVPGTHMRTQISSKDSSSLPSTGTTPWLKHRHPERLPSIIHTHHTHTHTQTHTHLYSPLSHTHSLGVRLGKPPQCESSWLGEN